MFRKSLTQAGNSRVATMTASVAYGLPARRGEWILAAGTVTGFGYLYAEAVSALVAMWRSSPMYSYGPLIPIISAYLVWARRDRLRDLPVRPNHALGWPVLATGLVALLVGKAGGVIVLQELSLIPALMGLVLLAFGRRFLTVLWAPIAYLFFMIPVWDGLTERLHEPFQNFSAENGLWLLNLVGVPAHRQGVFLELPNLTLEVARACSGVNYLVAVVAIGLPLAALYLDTWSRRLVLLVSAVLIAIAANSVRVALIGILAYYQIGSPLHGPFHVLQGLFVAVVGYGALFAGLWVLSRGRIRSDGKHPSATMRPRHRDLGATSRLGTWFGLLGVVVAFSSYQAWAVPVPIPLTSDLARLPSQIGEWERVGDVVGYAAPLGVRPDHEVHRRYARPSGGAVEVYVGYFASQTQGKELFDHRTTDLHVRARPVTVVFPDGERRMVNGVFGSDRRGSYAALFWYDLNGRVVADRYRAKLYAIWDALVHRRTNGTVVWLRIDVAGERDYERGIATLTAFAEAVYPVLKEYHGGWNAPAVSRPGGSVS